MDLKMHLEIVAPFVGMAEGSTMCECELDGTPATRRVQDLGSSQVCWELSYIFYTCRYRLYTYM